MRTFKAGVDLPTVAENPQADIVLFDGHCMFCLVQSQRLARWDTRRRLAFLSLHDPEVESRFPDLTYDRLMEEMHVVDRQGRRHAGVAALRHLSTRLPMLYPLAPLLHLPFSTPLWRWAYRQIATRRYFFLGRTEAGCTSGACELHL
jgi:predicted DCC family thiol-disulfide oxidoreductase YuxK